MERIRWGVLSTAAIGVEEVIPAMRKGKHCEVIAIASRGLAKARAAAAQLGIPRAYGSYEALLADPDIDAIYNPLPNSLHASWSIKAIEAGKHLLCEKPLALTGLEAQRIVECADANSHLKVMEGFMYRHHPQWQRARQIVADGGIGRTTTIQSFFSFYNDDPGNIRNILELGGGALLDIGCYCISASRFIFGSEPKQVLGTAERDPRFKTDRYVAGMLDFGPGSATFTCNTQLAFHQRVNILGTKGRIEIESPFSVEPSERCRIWHHHGAGVDELLFDPTDHYAVECDQFSLAVLNDTEVPTSIEDGVANMRVIDAFARSCQTGGWTSI